MSYLVDVLLAIGTGMGLWAVLPRGVVLIRGKVIRDHDGRPVNDTWQLTNDSPLSIKITSAKYYATETLNDPNGPWLDLRPGLYEERGLDLHLDDEMSEMQRVDTASPTWRGVLIRPGDTLTACVPNLVDLRINYRRAGLWGLAERRSVWVRGGV